jgi:hypothetical protein
MLRASALFHGSEGLDGRYGNNVGKISQNHNST